MGLIGGIIQTAGNAGLQGLQQNWNEQMYGKQKEFWYEQQEYNSPANQVERLKEAGINPALALGNIQSGQMGSAPAVPSMSAAQAGSFAGATDSILSLINNKKQMNKVESDTRKQNADAFLDEIDAFTRFADNVQKIRESLSRENKNKVDSFVTDMLGGVEYQMKQLQTEQTAQNIEIGWLNYAKGLVELDYLPAQQRAAYLERMANIAKMEAETESEKQRKRKLIQETNHEFYKAKGQKFVNSLNQKTEQYLIDKRQVESYPESSGRIAGGIAREGSKFIDKFLGF